MIFDTHTHYDDEAYEIDRAQVLESLQGGGIGRICNIGSTFRGACESLKLAEQYDFIYAAVGIHPDEVAEMDEEKFEQLKEMASHPRAVAIGEIGLDYHGFDRWPDKPGKKLQQYWFERQLNLAIELDMPVVIHSRSAAQDTLEMLTAAHARGLKSAVLHCFSYSKEVALEYAAMGFYIGFGGTLTYEGQKKLTKVLEAIPADRILLETDCPYLTPRPYRDSARIREAESSDDSHFVRNCSLYLPPVRDKMAEIKGLTPQEVEQITWDNAHRFFRIPMGAPDR